MTEKLNGFNAGAWGAGLDEDAREKFGEAMDRLAPVYGHGPRLIRALLASPEIRALFPYAVVRSGRERLGE